ncbi:ETEC_3214 domain-containing protein [Streptomyces sp. NPDC101175]|uniref:ETEC_3214 domain-containing protein n=1 Tax=Streptomyces sp. NPDC101175 TaxID=3366123 RepID=UPI003832899F
MNWHGLGTADAIKLGASAAGVWGFLVTTGKFSKSRYAATIGKKRQVRRQLNKLAVGSTLTYVESLFGAPVFEQKVTASVNTYVYKTKYAWIEVKHAPETGVSAFSITVSHKRFRYSTKHLTWDGLPVKLGKSTFQDLSSNPDGRVVRVGANKFLYAESHYLGNPGNYQHFIFSHTDAGVGNIGFVHMDDCPIAEGFLSEDDQDNELRDHKGLTEAREKTVINTFSTGASFLHPKQIGFGADWGTVRALRD